MIFYMNNWVLMSVPRAPNQRAVQCVLGWWIWNAFSVVGCKGP